MTKTVFSIRVKGLSNFNTTVFGMDVPNVVKLIKTSIVIGRTKFLIY